MSENAATSTPIKLSLPLAFQQSLFHHLRSEDTLLLLAPGLGLLRILANFLHAYDAAGPSLILLLGATDQENAWLGEALAESAAVSSNAAHSHSNSHSNSNSHSHYKGLTIINTQLASVTARQRLYAQGAGICSVTGTIAVLDFLAGVVPARDVTGVVVLHAERVSPTTAEAFVLRMFRAANAHGFIKAFSDAPERFAGGGSRFAPLQGALRTLFLRQVALWPRFQIEVVESLEGKAGSKRKAEVVELEVPLTESMATIQTALVECVEVSLAEVRRAAGHGMLADVEGWDVDEALKGDFANRVDGMLYPIWHRLNPKTKMVANDLRTLQGMMEALLRLDPVKFLQFLDTVIIASEPRGFGIGKGSNISPWLHLDAASTIFETAKARVYTGTILSSGALQNVTPILEELPKWAVLQEVLEEIERDAYFNSSKDDSSGAILIMCSDQATAAQLREFLHSMKVTQEVDEHGDVEWRASADPLMKQRFKSYVSWKRQFNKVGPKLLMEDKKPTENAHQNPGNTTNRGKAPPNKRRRVRGGGSMGSSISGGGTISDRFDVSTTAGDNESHLASLLNNEADIDANDSNVQEELGADPMHNMEDYYQLFDMNDLVVIHPYKGDLDDHLLEEIKPRYVVMYEPNTAFIRRVEVYRSCHTDRNVRVYFLYYKNSVEEQRYLSGVRKEKDAFTRLIRERANMSITIDVPISMQVNPEEKFLRTINTRIAGGGRLLAATNTKPLVVVDTREFRSSLPSLLHARGIDVIPAMLNVGDYILTPELAIERKSISDLVASLANGRLFNQAETMLANYKTPALLIEFGQSSAFTLEPFADYSAGAAAAGGLGGSAAADLQSKIVILTLAFPQLRIIWSSSPYQTAEIFEELKRNAREPDPRAAAAVGTDDDDANDEIARAWNTIPMDMLREIPGVDASNMGTLAGKTKNIKELANLEQDDLAALVGREKGRMIWGFFNKRVAD